MIKQVTVQQHLKNLERNKLLFKTPPKYSNQQLDAPLECLCAKFLSNCDFSCTTSRHLLGWHMTIWCFMYTFHNICRNLTALGVRNALWSVESSNPTIKISFFTCHPAKDTALPMQHTRTLKHSLGARISDLLSKYEKASSITSQFGEACLCSVHNICP